MAQTRPVRRFVPWVSVLALVLLAGGAAAASTLTAPAHSPAPSPTVEPSGPASPGAPTPASIPPSSTAPPPPVSVPSPTTTTAPVTPSLATGEPPTACPSSAPPQPQTPASNEQVLVPTGATSVLLCDYETLNPPLGLNAERTITDSAMLARLTEEANSGSVPSPGTAQSCPVDLGQDVDAYFSYPTGEVLWLWVDMGGCTPIVDHYGWSEDWTLVNDLQGLLGLSNAG